MSQSESGVFKVFQSSGDAEEQGGASTLVSRNITVFDRRTSIRLEPEMWKALREIASREKCTIHDVCSLISLRKREKTSLTAAIRVFIMLYFRAATTEQGHASAGHGNFKKMLKRARVDESAVQSHFSNRKGAPGLRTGVSSGGIASELAMMQNTMTAQNAQNGMSR